MYIYIYIYRVDNRERETEKMVREMRATSKMVISYTLTSLGSHTYSQVWRDIAQQGTPRVRAGERDALITGRERHV